MKPKKPSAADRTVSMFSPVAETIDSRTVEVVPSDEKAERVTMEQDADRLRDGAFKAQEWATKAFGIPEAQGNEYRVTRRGQHYYLETLSKQPGAATAYGYVGVMLHERDLYAATQVLVQAVRDKQKRDSNGG